PVRARHHLLHPPDLPLVLDRARADDDLLAVRDLTVEAQPRLQKDGAESTLPDLPHAEAVARDPVPTRLLEDHEGGGVVDVAEEIQVSLVDQQTEFVMPLWLLLHGLGAVSVQVDRPVGVEQWRSGRAEEPDCPDLPLFRSSTLRRRLAALPRHTVTTTSPTS